MMVSVAVRARTDVAGRITPETLVLRGQALPVERVLERREARETKFGGRGTRYLVIIGQARLKLFLDDEQRWFLEEDEHVREVPYLNGG